MFLGQNPRAQTVFRIVRIDGDGGLHNNRAVIHFLVNQMDGCAANPHSAFQSLTLSVQTGEGRQEGRVDIQNPLRESLNKTGREQAHKAGQNDQFNLVVS